MKKRLVTFIIIDCKATGLKEKDRARVVVSENLLGKGGLFSLTKDGVTEYALAHGSSPTEKNVGDSVDRKWFNTIVRPVKRA